MESTNLGRAHAWLTDFLCFPDDRIGRAGAVCPFVAPALRAKGLRLEEWPVDHPSGYEELMALARRMVTVFQTSHWTCRNRTLRALVVNPSGLAPDRFTLADEVQAALKPELAAKGLMLGQFHARCDEPAARNPQYQVSRSPVPLLALRQMAVHDVLFLHRERSCFTAYDRHYGARYDRGLVPDPVFRDVFADARARFGTGEHHVHGRKS